jgi:hypothetical protein
MNSNYSTIIEVMLMKKELVVFGHVLNQFSKEYNFRKRNFQNANSVIQMFTKPTQQMFRFFLHWQNQNNYKATR